MAFMQMETIKIFVDFLQMETIKSLLAAAWTGRIGEAEAAHGVTIANKI